MSKTSAETPVVHPNLPVAARAEALLGQFKGVARTLSGPVRDHIADRLCIAAAEIFETDGQNSGSSPSGGSG